MLNNDLLNVAIASWRFNDWHVSGQYMLHASMRFSISKVNKWIQAAAKPLSLFFSDVLMFGPFVVQYSNPTNDSGTMTDFVWSAILCHWSGASKLLGGLGNSTMGWKQIYYIIVQKTSVFEDVGSVNPAHKQTLIKHLPICTALKVSSIRLQPLQHSTIVYK